MDGSERHELAGIDLPTLEELGLRPSIELLPPRLRGKISVDANGCWLWMGETYPSGYGMVKRGTRKHGRSSTTAHRFIYEWFNGLVPQHLHVDHLCRNVVCCNPKHMEPVTPRENVRRSPLANENKSQCPSGHLYTRDNTYLRARGGRECRICMRNRARNTYRKQRQERGLR